MSYFTAIDFETAAAKPHSICQIGLVVVEDCKIVDRLKYMVQPPGNIYLQRNIDIHGIYPDRTRVSPTFDKVWPLIEKHIAGKNVVAHNAMFEINCLQKTLYFYGLRYPKINWHCTYKIYKEKLGVACARKGIKMNKAHDALSDAEATALLMIQDIWRSHAK